MIHSILYNHLHMEDTILLDLWKILVHNSWHKWMFDSTIRGQIDLNIQQLKFDCLLKHMTSFKEDKSDTFLKLKVSRLDTQKHRWNLIWGERNPNYTECRPLGCLNCFNILCKWKNSWCSSGFWYLNNRNQMEESKELCY